ncbi:MAG: phycobilisome rod-core linker polypeptide [Synechococcus sp.]
MNFGSTSRLGLSLYETSAPIEQWPGQSSGDTAVIIRAVYKQVLGNAHIMDSERLVSAESKFTDGELSVREFVRAVGKSSLYSSLFGDRPRFRQIELGYKHFLGRAPNSYSEMQAGTAVLDTGSFDNLIDFFVDSNEYESTFGSDTVPYIRGYKTEALSTNAGFSYMFDLLRGPATSDAAVASALNGAISKEKPRSISLSYRKPTILPYGSQPSYQVPTTSAAIPTASVDIPSQPATAAPEKAPLFSGESTSKLGVFGRIVSFVEQLTGGDGSSDAAVTASQSKEEFFLDPDDARSLGDVEYMRAPRTIKRTFPNAANPEKPLEFEAVVTATEKVISPEKDKPTGLPTAAPTKPKDVKIPVVTGTPAATSTAPASVSAVSASLMEFGTTASRAGKSGPYVSMSMSPEVSTRRKKDNSLDLFRKMATDLRRSE